MSKRILAIMLALLLIMLAGCNEQDDENTESMGSGSGLSWSSEDLQEFGLKNAKCPKHAVIDRWSYYTDTHSIVAVLSGVDDCDEFVEDIFNTAKKSAGGQITDAYGNSISNYEKCLTQFDMYVFYYQANGQKYYASILYYEDGSELLHYKPKSALMSVRNVAYISYG